MIKYWEITGDCHQDFSRFNNYPFKDREDYGLIILGDASWNYWINNKDKKIKQFFHDTYKFTVYCVRGNHEARPQDIEGMILTFDDNVNGQVYYEPDFPRIRYFKDWGSYRLKTNDYGNIYIAVIGGAYSVDKYYRLARKYQWFENEELSEEEMAKCEKDLSFKAYDIVFSHTCPLKWEPTDLFLPSVDQSTVSKRMENFLNNLEERINYHIWLFGHYHQDRIERPYVEQFYTDTCSIEEVLERWENYGLTKELDWWLTKSPNFEEGENDK